VTFDALRRSFCTDVFDAEEDLVTVQKLAPHSKASTSADVHLHKNERKRRDAAESAETAAV
jgi:hypothetical protein